MVKTSAVFIANSGLEKQLDLQILNRSPIRASPSEFTVTFKDDSTSSGASDLSALDYNRSGDIELYYLEIFDSGSIRVWYSASLVLKDASFERASDADGFITLEFDSTGFYIVEIEDLPEEVSAHFFLKKEKTS